MPSQKSTWRWIDLSPQVAVANTNVLVEKPVPFAGVIKEAWLVINTILTTGGGVAALAKSSTNILSATNVNLGSHTTPDVTAATPKSLTLSTSTMDLKVATTDVLKATFTLTTAAITNAIGCLVAIEPDFT